MLNDPADLLSIFLRGALGAGGRKRARRAARFLGGNRGFLTASTLLAATGVAWGVYDHLKGQQAAAAPGGAGVPHVPQVPGVPPVPGVPHVPSVPSVSSVSSVASVASVALPSEALRLVRLAVSAARADGVLSPAERALILEHARTAGIGDVVAGELEAARPLAEIVDGVADDQHRRDLYTLAFTIVRADENVSGAERVYLAQLAHRLGLDPSAAAALEAATAAKIDAEPDTM
ncbi:MAG: DUF533 domain-containing protein [Vicinamibacterales bacterium]